MEVNCAVFAVLLFWYCKVISVFWLEIRWEFYYGLDAKVSGPQLRSRTPWKWRRLSCVWDDLSSRHQCLFSQLVVGVHSSVGSTVIHSAHMQLALFCWRDDNGNCQPFAVLWHIETFLKRWILWLWCCWQRWCLGFQEHV